MKYSFPNASVTHNDVVEGLEFVESMLCVKPEARISAERALRLPFIKDAKNGKLMSADLQMDPVSHEINYNSTDGQLVSFVPESFLDNNKNRHMSKASISLSHKIDKRVHFEPNKSLLEKKYKTSHITAGKNVSTKKVPENPSKKTERSDTCHETKAVHRREDLNNNYNSLSITSKNDHRTSNLCLVHENTDEDLKTKKGTYFDSFISVANNKKSVKGRL